MTKSEILKDWYRRVWIEHDMDAIDEYFDASSAAGGLLPDFSIGSHDFRVFATTCLALVESVELRIAKVIEEGDWASALIFMQAVNPATGQHMATTSQLTARFDGNKIVEAYNAFDFLALFQQLGLLPDHTLELCLSGQKVA